MTRAGSKPRRSPAAKSAPVLETIQIIAADPGWHALYEGEDGPAMAPLACFALVEYREPGEAPVRAVRPFVAHDGTIDDAALRDGFVDLLPPSTHTRGKRELRRDHDPGPGVVERSHCGDES